LKRNLLVFILFVVAFSCFAEEKEEKKADFAVFPQFAYSQETGFWGGLITYYRYKLKSIPEHKNYLDFQIVYTQKEQLQLKFYPILHFREGSSKLELELIFEKWPSEFYGVNNTDPAKEMSKYTAEMVDFNVDFQHNFAENLYYHLYSDQLKSVILDRKNPTEFKNIPGNEPYFLSGIGAGLAFDSRDYEDFPSSGSYASLSLKSYRNWWGSDYDYEEVILDFRQFVGINRNHVFAFQQYFSYHSNIAPFHELYRLGEYVRAFKNDIFLNNHGIAFRAEYRFFPFTGKYLQNIGFATFFDTGQGMQDLNDFVFSNFLCSFGAGLRISIFLEDRYNLRFDYGECSTNGAMNIGGGETF
jgi:outer membrane protein assembly factor BamA